MAGGGRRAAGKEGKARERNARELARVKLWDLLDRDVRAEGVVLAHVAALVDLWGGWAGRLGGRRGCPSSQGRSLKPDKSQETDLDKRYVS